MRTARLLGAATLAGAGALAYGVGLRAQRVHPSPSRRPVLSRGSSPLRVLHLSDLHMLDRQRSKQEWIQDLGRLLPDLVVLTGDVLSANDAGPSVLRALAPLLDRPGIFVPGNNDYYEPTFKNPFRYVTGSRSDTKGNPIDWDAFARELVSAGWQDMTNVRADLKISGRMVDVRGVDDPYLRRDRLDDVRGKADPKPTFASASPTPRSRA